MLSIYKASAGSGKTFRLAYEYIKMLLGVKNPETGDYSLNRCLRDRHRHILAVTFTNKATDEMKRRIIHELAVLGGMEPGWGKPSDYLDDLCRELNCSSDELCEASASALRQLLFDFNFFQVSTIDSFFQIILRTFAREADIAGNYEVDLDNDRAVGQGVRELFDSLTIDSRSPETRRLLQWITQYLIGELAAGKQVMLFNRQSNVHARFLNFIKSISNDTFFEYYDAMSRYLAKPERLQGLAQSLADMERLQLEETRSASRHALDVVARRGYGSSKGHRISSALLKQLEGLAVAGEELKAKRTVDKVYVDPSAAYVGGLDKYLSDNPDGELEAAVMEACRSAVEGAGRLGLYRAVRANLFVLGLLERVNFHINRYRNENNTIYLSDTNALLRKIIGEEEDNGAPFIYERVGVAINHYLIDEFQDTSRIQWENFCPLLGQGLSVGYDSLIIGDEKQCIYRFRFSDPSLLQNKVQSHFRDFTRSIGADADGNTNWRSSADVVAFNNDVFSTLAKNIGFDDIYANVRQRVSPAHISHRGYVKVAGFDAPADDIFKKEALEMLARDIVRQLKSGYNPCDIAILARFNKEAADIISYLMEARAGYPKLAGIGIMSDDAMSVASAPAVKLIVSVMRFIAMPDGGDIGSDGVYRRKVRLREIGRLINSYEHLLSTVSDSSMALRMALASMATGDSGQNSVEMDIVGSMECINLPSLVERIIVRYISPVVAKEQNMYISAFVDVVTDFCSRGAADLSSFLQWWDDSGCRSKISAPFDKNCIRVMTIHKSKGLEFKCVHIPFVNWKMIDFRDLEWFETGGGMPGIDPELVPPIIPLRPVPGLRQTQFAAQYDRRCREQLLDELNVLYVAMTRAVDELSIGYRLVPGKPESYMVSDMLAGALRQMDMESSEADGSGCTVLFRGQPTVPRAGKAKPHTALEPGLTEPMAAYETGDRDDLWGNLDIERYLDYGVARERGIVLHDVLSRVYRYSDLTKAVRFCSYHGRLPGREAEEVISYLSEQLQRPGISQWFDGFIRVVRERSLVLPDGSVCRPDRVVWTADGHCDVIDYKFGQEIHRKYSRQVGGYMLALRGLGNENIRGFIWYVDSSRIVPVAMPQ